MQSLSLFPDQIIVCVCVHARTHFLVLLNFQAYCKKSSNEKVEKPFRNMLCNFNKMNQLMKVEEMDFDSLFQSCFFYSCLNLSLIYKFFYSLIIFPVPWLLTRGRYAIATGKSYNYILQFAISLGQLYGTAAYFITSWLEGDNFAASPFYYYAYYIGANASWVVIPTLISIRCWKKICAAIQVEGQKKRKVR